MLRLIKAFPVAGRRAGYPGKRRVLKVAGVALWVALVALGGYARIKERHSVKASAEVARSSADKR